MLGSASADLYGRALDIVLKDEGSDGALVVLTPQAMTNATATAERMALAPKDATKPVLASWMGGASLEPARAVLNAAGIPTYDYPDAAARAFALMWRYSDNLRLLYESPVLPHDGKDAIAKRRAAERLIKHARRSHRTLLTEVES
jgi:acetyltransferase